MKQEEKSLLLKDLCARLPYRVKCIVNGLDDCTLMPSDIEEKREREEVYAHEKRHIEDRIMKHAGVDDIESA